METGLTIRDVDFNGAVLKAAQDMESIIWVGIRWVCEGLGLSDGQTKRERKRLQDDLFFAEGRRNLVLPTNGGLQEVLCLQLDYLPLWLAKISITPSMKRDNPELVNKLIIYQLKAKDVLVQAFLPSYAPTVAPQQQTVQLTLPSYEIQFEQLNQKVDKLYKDMGSFAQVMLDWKEAIGTPQPLIQEVINTYTNVMDNLSLGAATSGCKDWKNYIYGLTDQLIRLDSKFSDRGSVLQHIYKYMNKNYGIVWAQEQKDYQERYNCSRPSCIDVVYDKEMYKSIFESVLIDLVANREAVKITNIDTLDEIIRPLIDKRSDKSRYGCATYRMVYRQMENNYGVNWKNHITRFMKVNKSEKSPTKKSLILAKPGLLKKFEKSVDAML